MTDGIFPVLLLILVSNVVYPLLVVIMIACFCNITKKKSNLFRVPDEWLFQKRVVECSKFAIYAPVFIEVHRGFVNQQESVA